MSRFDLLPLTAILVVACSPPAADTDRPDAPRAPERAAAQVSEPLEAHSSEAPPPRERAGDEIELDRRADGATLFGTLEPFPENADPDRVLVLRTAGLPGSALDGARVLDARFAASGIVVLGADHELVLLRPDGTRVTLDTEAEGPLSVEADRVAYVRGQMPEYELALADLPSLSARTVTQGMAAVWSPALSQDGTEVVFVSSVTGSPRLYRMPASGGEPRLLPPSDRFPSSPFAPRWEGNVLRFEDERGASSIVIAPSSVPTVPGDDGALDPIGGGR